MGCTTTRREAAAASSWVREGNRPLAPNSQRTSHATRFHRSPHVQERTRTAGARVFECCKVLVERARFKSWDVRTYVSVSVCVCVVCVHSISHFRLTLTEK